jgi:glyoxylase-like metal-dependent hydrolase (beta-lactamase superfamily II)
LYQHIEGNIYSISIDLPETPLKRLNAYVIKGNDRSLLIDTGFNCDISWHCLDQGLQALDIDMTRTDIFLTHAHADHAGLANRASAPGTQVYVSRRELELLHTLLDPENDLRNRKLNLKNGFSPAELTGVPAAPLRNYQCTDVSSFHPVEDGQVLSYGGRDLTAILTPGHTPGHMCLYDAENQIMFLGDHVLFDISPNIAVWKDFPDPLGDYVHSLQRIAKYPVRLALPAHRSAGLSANDRIFQIIDHHGARLRDIYAQLKQLPGSTPYQLAAHTQWNIHGAETWDSVPYNQKWFAVRETAAHLEYLRLRGLIRREDSAGIFQYFP